MFEVPTEWDWTTVADVAAPDKYSCVGGPFGSNLTRRDYTETPGVPVIRGQNLGDDNIRFKDSDFVFVSGEKADQLIQNMAYPGDLVFTQRGTLGQVGWIPGNAAFDRYVVSQSQMKLSVNRGRVSPGFIYAYFRSSWAKAYIDRTAITTGVPHINLSILRAFPIPLPPLPEQRRIAAVLGALDDKIELNRQMNRTLEEMAQAVFKSWFIDFDGHEVVAQELIDSGLLLINDGYRAKRSELADRGLPFARAGNINNGFKFDGAELLGEDGISRAGFKASKPYDVLFTSKGTVGRFAFVTPTTPRFVYSPQLCFWRSLDHQRLSPFYLLHWMTSRAFLRQVASVKGQTDMADYVSLRDQRRMMVTVPPIEDQANLAAKLRPLSERKAVIDDENQTLSALRDTLLPKLISGQVRVPDAEDAVEEHL